MTKPNILVVDSDEGFGHMLAEGLQNTNKYAATWVNSGSQALESVVENSYDLVIIDIALTDMSPATLVQAIRDAKNELRIMLIPLIGQDLPAELKELKVNGVLPKPFFVGDLPDLVDKAMGRTKQRLQTPAPMPVASADASSQAAAAATSSQETIEGELPAGLSIPTVPQETIRFMRANENEILRLLSDLNREIRAEAILLIAGVDLIAQAGSLPADQGQELALLVAQNAETAALTARFLGEKNGYFNQSLHEGRSYRLYSLGLEKGIFLSLALSTNVPLGMIRHQCRQIAEQLGKFII